jgi:tetratricopeptide (TPR) repeat protein
MNGLKQLLFCIAITNVFFTTGCIYFYKGSLSLSPTSEVSTAEQYEKKGSYNEAIKLYRDHITSRLEDTKRPDWENPYFYEVTIGDIEKKRGNIENALKEYESALSHQVDTALIADRIRQISMYYENKNDLQISFELLKKYRSLDTFLFDNDLDRISKKLAEQE